MQPLCVHLYAVCFEVMPTRAEVAQRDWLLGKMGEQCLKAKGKNKKNHITGNHEVSGLP